MKAGAMDAKADHCFQEECKPKSSIFPAHPTFRFTMFWRDGFVPIQALI